MRRRAAFCEYRPEPDYRHVVDLPAHGLAHAVDPALLPAVGTPEPGGLEWYEVLALLRAAARRHPVVMADVMELAPAEGPVAAAFTAAKLVYKLIGYALRLGA
jgi:agmatinase